MEWTTDLSVPKSVWLSGERLQIRLLLLMLCECHVPEVHSRSWLPGPAWRGSRFPCALGVSDAGLPCAGLFNPQSFLTAVMQTTARRNGWPLDKTVIVTEVTKRTPEQVGRAASLAWRCVWTCPCLVHHTISRMCPWLGPSCTLHSASLLSDPAEAAALACCAAAAAALQSSSLGWLHGDGTGRVH